ncbi:MAG: hypothetical protein IKO40_08485 [Kiritimatiellae bacterium]|nr:hypothetical protein [Kiritimatiellia bacterium]
MEALTFRAEPEFIKALKDYADRLGISVNAALREIVAPVIGVSKRLHTSRRPKNNLARFRGTLTKEDLAPIIAAQGDFSKIDEDMWK